MNNVVRRTVNIKSGAYGPAHDPYGYREYSMSTTFSDGSEETVTVHNGLDEWFSVNGERRDNYENEAGHEFEAQVGTTVDEFTGMIESVKAHRTQRCPKCGGKRIYGQSGFPGEYLYICNDCHALVDSEFDLAEVM